MKRSILLVVLYICMMHSMHMHADITQNFDFPRRYGTDSHILNSASYFNSSPRTKARSAQKNKCKHSNHYSRIKKNQKA